MSKKFTKNIENFTCENCGNNVIGNGYTNHCPKCLYSKHVDINPGDRLCKCNGLMKPIYVLQNRNDYTITHKCIKCGYVHNNKSSKNDDTDTILSVIKTEIKNY